MFGRHATPDGDVVAAAQRRLAALVAQHSDTPASVPEPADADEVPAEARRMEAPSADVDARPAGRHIGVRRSELGRWGVSAQHVTVAALLVVRLVVAVAWWALRSVPHVEPVRISSQRFLPSDQTPGSSATTAAVAAVPPGGAAAGPRATDDASRLVIDVAGKVRHPGIVELPAGSRVVDAIAAAGGARPGVSLTSLNLARRLVDGEQIVVGFDVPVIGGSGSSAAGGSTSDPVLAVDLNTATAEQLDTLPDVGPVTAQAILQWRADNGPFTSVDDLLEVSGIAAATLADIRPYVYV